VRALALALAAFVLAAFGGGDDGVPASTEPPEGAPTEAGDDA